MCKNMRPRKDGYYISEFLLKAKGLNNIMTSDIFKRNNFTTTRIVIGIFD